MKFCAANDKDCETEITTVARNTEFIVQHEFDLTDDNTKTLKDIYELYPDSVSIGPFLPAWSLETGYGTANNGVAITIKSNVAFAASITVTSRLWA